MGDSSPSPPVIKRAVIACTLHCRGCGYNLRGVRVEHPCPECGLPVEATVTAEVDPEASRLPRLRDQRLVGSTILLVMTLDLAIAAMALLAVDSWGNREPILRLLVDVDPRSKTAILAGGASALSLLGASACLFLGSRLWSGEDRTPRSQCLVSAAGQMLIAAASGTLVLLALTGGAGVTVGARAEWTEASLATAMALGGALALRGQGRLLRIVGSRSRVYREARGGRQGMRAMSLALLALMVGVLADAISEYRRLPALERVGEVLVQSSVVMLLIGLAYLVVNGWWIFLALRRSSLRLRDVIRIEPDASRM
ncbi:MAG: hypothetical protein HRU76_04275 [Phycisphaeraceae bacterium]|nr:MAG: hypothetical protein HRU76_04275 [Phycisphaeraceae bacterium]